MCPGWKPFSGLPIEIDQPAGVFAGLWRMVMSVSAISANGYFDYSAQSTFQKLQQAFQQLGNDLQAGNLTAAESDFVTLQQDLPQATNSSSSQSTNPIAQAFNQLSQDLEAGNLTAAQQDYATIKQDLPQQTASFSSSTTQSTLQQAFQQLGNDLQAGNLTAAESDFATLQQDLPQETSNSFSQSTNPIAQAFSQLSQDLQAGNLTAAQQDFATIKQDLQAEATQGTQFAQRSEGAGRHHHHHGGSGHSSGSSEISQLMTQLGQELQSGSLSPAQQTYASLQKDFRQFSQNGGQQAQTSSEPDSSTISVSV